MSADDAFVAVPGADAGESAATRSPYDVLARAYALAREFLDTLPSRPAVALDTVAAAVPEGIGVDAALAHFAARYAPQLSGSAGPRYFGFVTGGSSPAALAGDWLASAYDQNVSHAQGSVAAAIERETAASLARWFGLDDAMHGQFVSGATASNLVALATARQWAFERLGFDVAQRGLHGAPRVPVIGGSPHASIGKALSILGLGRDSLETVATLARRHGAWLHVDGAFGLFAALVPGHAAKVAGIAHADSVTVDLHKWLNVPYDAAVAYTRLPGATRAVFRSAADYLADAPDPLHLVPENSRRFRALPAWISIAAYGRAGIGAMVARNCAQARRFAEGLASIPSFELLDEVRLNIACFALRERDAAARDRVLERLARDGRAFMTPTTLFGRPAIRAAFSNWSTRDEDVAIALDALRAAL